MCTDTATFFWLKLDQAGNIINVVQCYISQYHNYNAALPLTVENVMNHISSNSILKKVNTLGKSLGIPEPLIQKITSSTSTNEDYLHRLISIWLKTEGIPASWRLLIWKLDGIDEIEVADQLKSFSEPLKGRYIEQ